MNLQQAYSILELSESASPEEAKKQYRNLTKKYHPDVNKEPDAEDKFKKINEAYECVKNGKGSDPEPNPFSGHSWNAQGFDISDFFTGNKKQTKIRKEKDIELAATISFKDSVLGTKHDVTYKRKIKCDSCEGSGEAEINNGCTTCGGKGIIISRNGNMISQTTCHKCFGRTNSENCKKCNQKGFLETATAISINIPPGILNQQTLRLQHMGNYAGSVPGFMGMNDMYSNTNVKITVTDDNGMRIDGPNVLSDLHISLLEAIQGTTKEIHTIDGIQSISIDKKSKNKDEIILPKLGINRQGDHKVILNVNYPDDIESLEQHLSANASNK